MSIPFEYTIKKSSRAKQLRITIEPSGAIIVKAPQLLPQFVIRQFVTRQQDWVLQHLAKLKTRPQPHNNSETVQIFGTQYQKKINFSDKLPVGMIIQGKNLIFNPTTIPIQNTPTQQLEWQNRYEKKLEQFLKSTAGQYIIPRTHALAEKMSLQFNKITLKKQKTRWGSCSSQKNLNFNWQLVHFSTEIIDYVIIHELAHLVHMNHSLAFWSLVAKYDPEYKKHVGWLKRNRVH